MTMKTSKKNTCCNPENSKKYTYHNYHLTRDKKKKLSRKIKKDHQMKYSLMSNPLPSLAQLQDPLILFDGNQTITN